MPKLTKKELDQRRRLRTKANREKPKRKQGVRASYIAYDEVKEQVNRSQRPFDSTPAWLSFQDLEKSPHFNMIMQKED